MSPLLDWGRKLPWAEWQETTTGLGEGRRRFVVKCEHKEEERRQEEEAVGKGEAAVYRSEEIETVAIVRT